MVFSASKLPHTWCQPHFKYSTDYS